MRRGNDECAKERVTPKEARTYRNNRSLAVVAQFVLPIESATDVL